MVLIWAINILRNMDFIYTLPLSPGTNAKMGIVLNGKPENVFVGLNALQHQDHAGIIAGIEEELAKVGIVLNGDSLV